MSKLIAVIGAGNVGRALATGWARVGHRINFGVVDPDHEKHAAARSIPGATVATVADAAARSSVVVLAVPWDAVAPALAACGDLSGKLLIDVTNPLTYGPAGLDLSIGFTRSGGEEVARLAPGAKVVKTLNQVGFEVMANASGYPAAPAMFVAGDDAAAKAEAMSLVADLGFEAIEAGSLRRARLLEPYAMVWIDQAVAHGAPRDAAFGFMRRSNDPRAS